MDTQNIRVSFNSIVQPIQTRKIYLISNLPMPSCSSNRISLNNRSCISSRTFLIKRNIKCRNSVDKVEYDKDNVKSNIQRKNLAVFVSGGGSNFKSIYEATVNGVVHANIVVLVTSKHDCGAVNYARDMGIPVIVFPKRKEAHEAFSTQDLVTTLRSYKIDFILLAGYLKIIPSELIQAFPKSILNIHPSLLPAFGGKGYYGMKVHKAVIASGARYSGPTIHYVDEEYDTGRILAQRVVPVLAKDTAEELAARVLHEEHKLYVEVVSALCEERITWRDDGVPLIQSKENPQDFS